MQNNLILNYPILGKYTPMNRFLAKYTEILIIMAKKEVNLDRSN